MDPFEQPSRALIRQWLSSREHTEFYDPASCAAMDDVISGWVEDDQNPLLVRRGATAHGGVRRRHQRAARDIVSCDNSPAEWIVSLLRKRATTDPTDMLRRLTDRQILNSERLPVNRWLSETDENDPNVHCIGSFNRLPTLADEGFYVAHVLPVGLLKRGDILDFDIGLLQDRSKRLLSPWNIIVVPKRIKGIADLVWFQDEALRWREVNGFRTPSWATTAAHQIHQGRLETPVDD